MAGPRKSGTARLTARTRTCHAEASRRAKITQKENGRLKPVELSGRAVAPSRVARSRQNARKGEPENFRHRLIEETTGAANPKIHGIASMTRYVAGCPLGKARKPFHFNHRSRVNRAPSAQFGHAAGKLLTQNIPPGRVVQLKGDDDLFVRFASFQNRGEFEKGGRRNFAPASSDI